MKLKRTLGVFGIAMFIAGTGWCVDEPVTIEVVGADQTPSVSSSADWGWWNPSKYPESWAPDENADLGLADIRMLVDYGEYTVILAGEWYPNLDATGSYLTAGSAEQTVQELTLKGTIYDLGFGRFYGRNKRNGVLPWIGATYMDLSESATTTPPAAAGVPVYTDTADSRLWGVVAGLDGSYQLSDKLDLAARLLFRWASGDRKATVTTEDGGEIQLKDSIDQTMWGADLGLRWHAVKGFWLEAGWRYRDRSLDDGPASFGGPQIKAAFEF
jgi:hypothetical protein